MVVKKSEAGCVQCEQKLLLGFIERNWRQILTMLLVLRMLFATDDQLVTLAKEGFKYLGIVS